MNHGNQWINQWTKNEISILEEKYPIGGTNIPELLITRSKNAIRIQASKYKISPSHSRLKDITTNPLTMSETEKAYLAGIFDGEGSIHMGQIHKTKVSKLRAWIEITNTNLELMRWIEEKLVHDKRISVRLKIHTNNGVSHLGKKPIIHIYLWRLGSVYLFLESILPYLIVKRKKAESVMDMIRKKLLEYDEIN